MNHLRGYKLAFWFMVIAVLCLLGIYWVAFKSGWAWYWRLLAYFLLVPTGWMTFGIAFALALDKMGVGKWGYHAAMDVVIVVLCLLGIYWVAFKSGWAWYWQLLAYFLLVPTVWSFIKFARADLELALTEWSAREPPSSERHD